MGYSGPPQRRRLKPFKAAPRWVLMGLWGRRPMRPVCSVILTLALAIPKVGTQAQTGHLCRILFLLFPILSDRRFLENSVMSRLRRIKTISASSEDGQRRI